MATGAETARRAPIRVAPVVADVVSAAISIAATAAASAAVAVLEESVAAAVAATARATATSGTAKAAAAAHVATAHASALVSLRVSELNVALLAADHLLRIGDGRLGRLLRLKDDEAEVARAVSLTIKGAFDVFNLVCFEKWDLSKPGIEQQKGTYIAKLLKVALDLLFAEVTVDATDEDLLQAGLALGALRVDSAVLDVVRAGVQDLKV